ncbi:MAG: threonine aldolase family protein [Alphaproteobacteria bacterium]|jgi:threonine aldolase|nr:threonine aldolase family protein [Alphaproteobacteria bacterium]
MTAIAVDLYSDTLSLPTPGMRKAIAEAEVGNEQAFEDPSVNRLCEMTAEMMGHEAAVFMPSGTMCNQVAFRVHCKPGDEIILDRTAHPLNSESGGPAALSSCCTRPLDGVRGIFTADQVRAAIAPKGRRHAPRSRVLEVENTANSGGGAVWPIEKVRAVTDVAHEHGLVTHLDGARLLNAVVASGTPAKDYGACFDSAWIDLSKGLGCPVGGVLVGSKAFVEDAWFYKQQLGGAMRQAGIVAAAGVYALENHVERLAEDHENARHLANQVAEIDGLELVYDETDTNMVYIDVSGTNMTAAQVHERLLGHGVRIGATGPTTMRAVTHIDISREDVETAAKALRAVALGE